MCLRELHGLHLSLGTIAGIVKAEGLSLGVARGNGERDHQIERENNEYIDSSLFA
jgi:hypothetical protein